MSHLLKAIRLLLVSVTFFGYCAFRTTAVEKSSGLFKNHTRWIGASKRIAGGQVEKNKTKNLKKLDNLGNLNSKKCETKLASMSALLARAFFFFALFFPLSLLLFFFAVSIKNDASKCQHSKRD